MWNIQTIQNIHQSSNNKEAERPLYYIRNNHQAVAEDLDYLVFQVEYTMAELLYLMD